MNTAAETNINVRLNPLDKNVQLRISYKDVPEHSHKKYVPEQTTLGSVKWKQFSYYRNDTKQVLPAYFSNEKQARRFLRKLLTANGIEIPEDISVIDQKRDQHYDIIIDGKKEETVQNERDFKNRWRNIIDEYESRGYKSLESSTQGYVIMVNYVKMKTVFLAYRRWLGFKDCDNKRIYEDDWLVNGDGQRVYLHHRDDGTWNLDTVIRWGEIRTTYNITQKQLKDLNVSVYKHNYEMFG